MYCSLRKVIYLYVGEASGSGAEGWDLNRITDNKEELKLYTTIEKLSEKHHDEKKNGSKVCYRKCSFPMSFAQCAVPRCAEKGNPATRYLCYWLCRHQKKQCKKVCV